MTTFRQKAESAAEAAERRSTSLSLLLLLLLLLVLTPVTAPGVQLKYGTRRRRVEIAGVGTALCVIAAQLNRPVCQFVDADVVHVQVQSHVVRLTSAHKHGTCQVSKLYSKTSSCVAIP